MEDAGHTAGSGPGAAAYLAHGAVAIVVRHSIWYVSHLAAGIVNSGI